MRIRSLVVLIIVALAGCRSSPDPRPRSLEIVQRDGYGAWAVIDLVDGRKFAGELIAVSETGLLVMPPKPAVQLALSMQRSQVRGVDVFGYHPETASVGVWGVLGTLGTISNGFFLVFTAPAWILVTAMSAMYEADSPVVSYPDVSWATLAKWARFPQGVPPNLRNEDLIRQLRAPAGAVTPVAPVTPPLMPPGMTEPTGSVGSGSATPSTP